MSLSEYQLAGRVIRILGVNENVQLYTPGFYKLFTLGAVPNITPEGITVVAYVSIAPNGGTPGTWAGVTTTFRINSPPWEATVLTLSNYPDVPAIVYGAGRPLTDGADFLFEVVNANAINYTATVTAYGWTI